MVLDLEDCKRRITEGVKNGIQAGGDVQINRESIKVIKRSSKLIKDGILDQDWISQVEEIEYPTKLPVSTSNRSISNLSVLVLSHWYLFAVAFLPAGRKFFDCPRSSPPT